MEMRRSYGKCSCVEDDKGSYSIFFFVPFPLLLSSFSYRFLVSWPLFAHLQGFIFDKSLGLLLKLTSNSAQMERLNLKY